MRVYAKTDVGNRRRENQDNFRLETLNGAFLAVVCDGMGGEAAGGLASGTAINAFTGYVKEHYDASVKPGQLLKNGVLEANRSVYALSQTDPSLSGMGTTLVAVLVLSDRIYCVNVGDSRLYTFTDGTVSRITRDHTYVRYLVDIGEMTLAEAEVSPERNILTRAVGTSPTVKPDVYIIERENDGETGLLLCSDGLHGEVSEDRMKKLVDLSDWNSVESSVNALISAANKNGGHDNITAVLMSV